MSFIVYLAGPIANCSDSECNDWREYAIEQLTPKGIVCLNPMRRDGRGHKLTEADLALIVERDKDDIRKSDLVLVHCSKASVGTSMEIMYAYMIGVPVYIYVPDKLIPSPWHTYHAKSLFYHFPSLIERVIFDAKLKN